MLLRKLLRLDKIYGRRYMPALFFDFAYVIVSTLATVIIVGLLGGLDSIPLLLPILFFALLIIFYSCRQVACSLLADQIINSRSYDAGRPADTSNTIEQSAISDELNSPSGQWFQVIEMKTKQIAAGDSWQAYDILCDTYSRYWGLRLRSAQALHTVFEAKLHHSSPHLVFDSKQGRKKQFRRLYVKSQKLVLGPGIDDFFSAYATGRRRSEALDILSADVKLALLALKEYDFELVDDILFCYAPLLPEEDLEVFYRRCLHLQAVVNDSLPKPPDDHSEDNLVQGDNLEQRLLKNPKPYVPMATVSGTALLGLILAAAVSGNGQFLKALPVFIAVFLFYGVKIARTLYRNAGIVRDLVSASKD